MIEPRISKILFRKKTKPFLNEYKRVKHVFMFVFELLRLNKIIVNSKRYKADKVH